MSERSTADGFAGIADLVEQLRTAADVETVYGEPVTQDGRTVIPVARVGYRFGAGFGGGSGGGSDEDDDGEGNGDGEGSGYGGGGGGAVTARPAGALEVSAEGTRFVGVGADRRRVFVAFLLGALAGWLLGSRD